MKDVNCLSIQKPAADWLRDALDKVYMDENFHCCTTDEYEIWHIADHCERGCNHAFCENSYSGISCGEYWSNPTLLRRHMRDNDFLKNLERDNMATSLIEATHLHFIIGHGKRIYNTQVPKAFQDELRAIAIAQRLYTKSSVIGVLINDKLLA